jgi:hypothetical protein
MYAFLDHWVPQTYEADLSSRILEELRLGANEVLLFLGQPLMAGSIEQRPFVKEEYLQWERWAEEIWAAKPSASIREVGRLISSRSRPHREEVTIRKIISRFSPMSKKRGNGADLKLHAVRRRAMRIQAVLTPNWKLVGPTDEWTGAEKLPNTLDRKALEISAETLRKLVSALQRDILLEIGGLEQTDITVRQLLSKKKRQTIEWTV